MMVSEKTACVAKTKYGRDVASWIFQLIASLSWFVSVFVYNSYSHGDYLQLVAAAAWMISNFVTLPDLIKTKGKEKTGSIELQSEMKYADTA